jgi:hypothetical protein
VKRGKKAAGEPVQHLVKSTYLLEPTLKQNLAYVALYEQKDQSDIVREALADYLDARGLNPNQPPQFHLRPKR